MKSIFVIICSALIALFLFSCAKPSSKEDLKDAQLCLNTASTATARSCVSKILSDNSTSANKLKCAMVFISEGVGATTFTDALDKLKNNGTCTGGCSSTVSAITTLNFHSGANLSTDAAARAVNIATSIEAFGYCSLSGAKILADISSLFRLGTEAAMLAYPLTGGGTPTEDQIKTAVASMDSATIGSIVTTTYNTSCVGSTSSSESMKKYCDELGASVAGGATAATIGACFKGKLANPAYVCP
ncbi:MAG: hypothetical protein H7061_11810 [Bdellovibrionaceae bacterium]|nr:hypothetical protein [Bdellovibrio sp.]